MAASLVQDFGIAVCAIHGEDTDTYYKHVAAALEHEPHVTMDDGADLVSAMVFIALDRLDDVHAAGPRLGREDDAGRAQDRFIGRARLAWRRRRPASSACGRWRRTACSSSR